MEQGETNWSAARMLGAAKAEAQAAQDECKRLEAELAYHKGLVAGLREAIMKLRKEA